MEKNNNTKNEAAIEEAISTIKTVLNNLLEVIDAVEPSKTTEVLRISAAHRALAIGRELDKTHTSFGEIIRLLVMLLAEQGVPQRTIAENLNISTVTLNRWLKTFKSQDITSAQILKKINDTIKRM